MDVNETFARFAGMPREDLIGRPTLEVGLWAIPQEREKFFAELGKSGTVASFPVSVRSESGEFRKALLSGEIIEIEGERCGLLMAQDITDLKRAEAAVEYSEARIRAMLSAVPDTIFLLSADGVYMDYHTYDPDHLIVPPEKFLGRNFEDVLPEKLVGQYEKAFYQARETGELQIFEYETKVRDETLHFESRLVPSGENEFLEIVRNVTEEKKLRVQLLASERLAAVGQTAAMAAHCMRNIFTAFRGANSLLNRALSGENFSAARQAQQLLERSAARLQMAFMEMLDYSRTRQPNRVELDLEALLKEVIKDLELLNYKRSEIRLSVEPEAHTAHLDRDWMYRSLLNLGSNALDAMPEGGRLELQATIRNHAGKKSCLIIEVRDSGTGIDHGHIPHLFEPLFTTKESRGTGLGLACVKQFIESQGGAIEVETAKGRGTTFRLVFDRDAQASTET
jgi:PAS domain S-box-containing protein